MKSAMLGLYKVFFLGFFLFWTIVVGVPSVVVSYWSGRKARWFQKLWAKTLAAAAGVRLRVEGLENLPPGGDGRSGPGMIIASNHCSSADIGAVLAGLPLDVCWVTKAELLKVPVIGAHLRNAHIPIARQQAGNMQKLLANGVAKIEQGAAVVIFPEGTRNRSSGKLLPFRRGAFVLAMASKRPVVPVAIVDSTKVWPPERKMPNPGVVTLRIGRPIDPNQFPEGDLAGLSEATRKAIADLLPD